MEKPASEPKPPGSASRRGALIGGITGTLFLVAVGTLQFLRPRPELTELSDPRAAAGRPGENAAVPVPPPPPEVDAYAHIRTWEAWIADIQRGIDELPIGGGAEDERYKRTLCWIFRNDRHAAALACDRLIKDHTLSWRVQDMVVLAVATEGELIERRELLRKLITSPGSPDHVKSFSMNALMWEQRTSAETTDLLIKLSQGDDDLALQAVRSIGSSIFELRETDPQRARQLTDRLLVIYRDRESRGSSVGIVASLQALATSRAPEADPILRAHLCSSDVEIRRAAVDAIGEYDPPDRYEIVLGVFKADTVAEVRIQAVWSLLPAPGRASSVQATLIGKLPPDVRATLTSALSQERDEEIRSQVIDYWIRCYELASLSAPAELIAAIRRVAESDPDWSIRSDAADAMRRIRAFGAR